MIVNSNQHCCKFETVTIVNSNQHYCKFESYYYCHVFFMYYYRFFLSVIYNVFIPLYLCFCQERNKKYWSFTVYIFRSNYQYGCLFCQYLSYTYQNLIALAVIFLNCKEGESLSLMHFYSANMARKLSKMCQKSSITENRTALK